MNGTNLVLIEISETTFQDLVTDGHLQMDDVVLIETYKAGIPQYTANLKLISQYQKDATADYREIMKKIDKLKADNLKLDNGTI